MNRSKRRRRTVALCAIVALSATAAAQDDHMADGEASINVRSDVKLGIKGTLGTTSERLQELTDAVTGRMGGLRKCYRDLLAKRPATVGEIAIRLTLERGRGKPKLELKEKGGSDADLSKCVAKVLSRGPYKGVGRPAAAIVTLSFQNTRAEGQKAMTELREEASEVDVEEGADGTLQASWATPDRKVAFVVRGGTKAGRGAVATALRGFKSSFASFLDCRRRSDKDGLSPAGDIEIDVRLARGGKASTKVKSSTVPHKRAVPCVERVLRRLKFGDGAPGKRVRVQVTFGA